MRNIILVSLILAAQPLFAETEYAQNCARVIGVPVPDIDCNSPGATATSPGRTSPDGKCENPSHLGSGCFPGTKFIRYTDTFTRNGREETVTTMVMCRKTAADVARNSDTYSDIGVIQYNETKHATCWFAATAPNQRMTKTIREGGRERMVYPSPNDPNGGMWSRRQEPSENCLKCHQSGVWLRSQFAMSVGAEPGKGFVRNGLDRPYTAGSGNNIPENHEDVAKRGIPCSVGLPAWNTPRGGETPFTVKINTAAFNEKLGLPRDTKSGSCTSCHYFGVGDLDGDHGMNCRTFLPEIATGNHERRLPDIAFEKRFWMPPGGHGTNRAEFMAEYLPGLRALAWCCDPAHRADRDFSSVCGGRFLGGRNGRELVALETNSCGLCPDCDTRRGAVHAGPGGGGRTH